MAVANSEMERVFRLVERSGGLLQAERLEEIQFNGVAIPLWGFTLGNRSPAVPTFGLFGGVHGLEVIGSQVVLTYLETLIDQIVWDKDLERRFEFVRLVSIPVINPGGILNTTRSNPAGVDLMRNAPQDAENRAHFLVGGHRLSPRLPYYRGKIDGPMEKEALALMGFVKKWVFPSKFSICLDLHSGFGFQDQIWHLYAGSRKSFTRLKEVQRWKKFMDATFPHHIYRVEPQSIHYTTHGDLWDYFYESFEKENNENIFLPLTLEMGSWLWLKKNPIQFFSAFGYFHPLKKHRFRRVMRRHLPLLDFILRSVQYHQHWQRY